MNPSEQRTDGESLVDIREISVDHDLPKEKRVAAFICSGGGPGKALDKLKTELDIPSFAATLSLIDPKEKPSQENERKIAAFCESMEKA